MWIDNLVKLVSDAPLQGYSLIAMALIVAGAMVWVSIDDIFHQEIYFWKLLIAGATTIVLPFIVSLLMGNWTLAACIFGSALLWIGFLAINIWKNNDNFIGKADIDIMSAVGSLYIGGTVWLYLKYGLGDIFYIQVSYLWYNFMLYFLVGSLFVIFIFLIIFGIRLIQKKTHIGLLLKFTKVAVVPMLLPVSVVAPIILLTM